LAKHVALPFSGTVFRAARSGGLPCITTQLRASYYLAQLSSGDRLPPVRALAKHLGISPTTALDLYRTLEEEGFVHGRERSGTFFRTVGREQRRSRRDVAAFKSVGATARRLRSQKISPLEFATQLLRYTGARTRDDFRFGLLAHREVLETTQAQLAPQIGFELPMAWLSPAADARHLLARDPAIRCLVSTFLFSARAAEAAEAFDLPLLMLRLSPPTVMSLQPSACGRRYIIVRDADHARDMRRLVCGLSRRQNGCSVCPNVLVDDKCEHCGRKDDPEQQRICIAALDEPERLVQFEHATDTFFASPMAIGEVRRRYGRSKDIVLLHVELSEETVDNLLFHYLFSTGAQAAGAERGPIRVRRRASEDRTPEPDLAAFVRA
jgi:DNA-binding transcriptional regulator YhcF (GntR family)